MYNVFQKIEKENNLKSLEASIPKNVNRIANVPRCHRPRGGSYRMVAGLTPIYATTKVVSYNSAHGEVYSIQHYVLKFVIDLRQVGGFVYIFRFPPPI